MTLLKSLTRKTMVKLTCTPLVLEDRKHCPINSPAWHGFLTSSVLCTYKMIHGKFSPTAWQNINDGHASDYNIDYHLLVWKQCTCMYTDHVPYQGGGMWKTDIAVRGGPLLLTWDLWWTVPRNPLTLVRTVLLVCYITYLYISYVWYMYSEYVSP